MTVIDAPESTQPALPEPPRKSSMRQIWDRVWRPGLIVLVALGVILGVVLHVAGLSQTVTGSITVGALIDDNDDLVENACIQQPGGYDDIHSGAQVLITDESGTTLGLGTLDAGKSHKDFLVPQCTYDFSVTGVATGVPFYGISVGNESRGTVRYTGADVKEPIELTLGD